MENKKVHRNIVKCFPFVDSDSLIKKIEKEYERGVDYAVDQTGNFYTILSERLEKAIWPNDCSPWEKSMVIANEKEGVVQKAKFHVERCSDGKESGTEIEQNVLPPLVKNYDELLLGASLFFLAFASFFLVKCRKK